MVLNQYEKTVKMILDMKLKESSNGKSFFNIKSTNGQVVGTSALFEDEEQRSAAISRTKS